jgi:acetoin utilization protein AcuB
MSRTLVKDWMTSDPIMVTSNEKLPDAYWRMINNKIRRLLVVDDDVLVGIVTLEDLRRAEPSITFGLDMVRISDVLSNLPVRQIMSKNPKTIVPNALLIDAARLMLENKISALPVLDMDKPVGIITESDIFRAMVEREQEETKL